MTLHPTIAAEYKLKDGVGISNSVHIPGLGVRDLSVTPLSAIKGQIHKISVLEKLPEVADEKRVLKPSKK